MNTTTKAQRTNKRQDAIWEKAKALATANTQDERILNASAKAIGPCHLPSKREMSDKSARTPGPWSAVVPPSSCLTDRFIEAENGTTVAEVGGKYSSLNGDIYQVVANARLIAAAPDLLEVCQWFAESCESQTLIPRSNDRSELEWFGKRLAAARAAIAKAEGRAQ